MCEVRPTLLSTIDGDSNIRLVAVTNAADPALPPAPLPPARPPKETNGVATPSQQPSSRYANGRRLKSIRGCDLVVETLRCGPATMEELKHTFEHRISLRLCRRLHMFLECCVREQSFARNTGDTA